jgi:hypothetical protein
MGESCIIYTVLARQTEEHRQVRRLTCICDNIKTDIKKIVITVDWIELAQDKDAL